MSVHAASVLDPEAPEQGVVWNSSFTEEENVQQGPSMSTLACVEMDHPDLEHGFLKQTLYDVTKTFHFELL